MFDLSFGKLLLVLVIGLVVLGPQRLPVAIKYVAGWIKTLRRISASVQLELSNELKLQELQDSLKKIEQDGINNISPEVKSSIERIKQSIQDLTSTLHQADEARKTSTDLSSPTEISSKQTLIDEKSEHSIIEGNEHDDRR